MVPRSVAPILAPGGPDGHDLSNYSASWGKLFAIRGIRANHERAASFAMPFSKHGRGTIAPDATLRQPAHAPTSSARAARGTTSKDHQQLGAAGRALLMENLAARRQNTKPQNEPERPGHAPPRRPKHLLGLQKRFLPNEPDTRTHPRVPLAQFLQTNPTIPTSVIDLFTVKRDYR